MAKPVRSKPQLTKAILDMKFMKKTKDRLEREQRDTQGHGDLYAASITHDMRHATGNYIVEPSFLVCEDLMQGRLSFKGMNPEIERLMELEDLKEDDMKKDVSDEQLSRQFTAFKRSRDFIKEEPVPRKRIKEERLID